MAISLCNSNHNTGIPSAALGRLGLEQVNEKEESPENRKLASPQPLSPGRYPAFPAMMTRNAAYIFNPTTFAPSTWYLQATSPPLTPGDQDLLDPSGGTKRAGRRALPIQQKPLPLLVDTQPEPPLSPPTSGSSPQSNGSTGDNKEKVFTCPRCNRSFGYKHVLQNHERTHTGEKPFECKQCHKRFTRDHHLKTHVRLHTGEKPYHCKHCDRYFVQVANLRRHLRVHTGEKPYACELCASKFSDSNQLKAHMLIHNGEKPFSCQTCGLTFRRRHHMVNHKCQPSKPEVDFDSEKLIAINNNNNNSSRRKSKDVRHVVREPIELPPEQTVPEDLSLPKSKLRSQLVEPTPSPYQPYKFKTNFANYYIDSDQKPDADATTN